MVVWQVSEIQNHEIGESAVCTADEIEESHLDTFCVFILRA